eukprot:EG_transcript_6127
MFMPLQPAGVYPVMTAPRMAMPTPVGVAPPAAYGAYGAYARRPLAGAGVGTTTMGFRKQAQVPLRPGQVICQGRYQIQATVGTGYYGQVFRARDNMDGSTVAVKVSPMSSQNAAALLQKEISHLQRLTHPNIVRYRGHQQYATTAELYMVLATEYCEGGTLRQRIEGNQLDTQSMLHTIVGIASALAHMHAMGIVHGDLRPANIIYSMGHPKVCDLGTSQPAGTNSQLVFMNADMYYTPPEGLTPGPLTNKWDLWSFGLTIFEMVANNLLWRLYRNARPVSRHPTVINEIVHTMRTGRQGAAARYITLLSMNPMARPEAAQLAGPGAVPGFAPPMAGGYPVVALPSFAGAPFAAPAAHFAAPALQPVTYTAPPLVAQPLVAVPPMQSLTVTHPPMMLR